MLAATLAMTCFTRGSSERASASISRSSEILSSLDSVSIGSIAG
jgi:hypothetical protein